jgi:biotin transport system substrate-specific component
MLATHIQTRTNHPLLVRALSIAGFAALTALAARLTINLPFTPVPLTLQVLAVLLAGLVLGARDGAASQLVYVAAVTAGLPLDARGLGTAVWATPTAGFLLGFIAGAFVAGWLAEQGLRRNPALRLAAGLAGVIVIYLFGALWLSVGFLGGDLGKGWSLGVAPFIAIDLAKAIIASGLAEAARSGLTRATGAW